MVFHFDPHPHVICRIADGHLRPPRVGGDHRQRELREFQAVQRGAEGASYWWYHLVMTNIAMENPNHKWRFIAGKIIYK